MADTSGATRHARFRQAVFWLAVSILPASPELAAAQRQTTVPHVVTVQVRETARVVRVSSLGAPRPDSSYVTWSGSVEAAGNASFALQARLSSPDNSSIAIRTRGGSWMSVSADAWVDVAALVRGLTAVPVEVRGPNNLPGAPPVVEYRAVVRQSATP